MTLEWRSKFNKIKTKSAKTLIVPKFLKCVHQLFFESHCVLCGIEKKNNWDEKSFFPSRLTIDAMFVHARHTTKNGNIISWEKKTKQNFMLQNKKHIKFNLILSVYFAPTHTHIKHIFRFHCTHRKCVNTHSSTLRNSTPQSLTQTEELKLINEI